MVSKVTSSEDIGFAFLVVLGLANIVLLLSPAIVLILTGAQLFPAEFKERIFHLLGWDESVPDAPMDPALALALDKSPPDEFVKFEDDVVPSSLPGTFDTIVGFQPHADALVPTDATSIELVVMVPPIAVAEAEHKSSIDVDHMFSLNGNTLFAVRSVEPTEALPPVIDPTWSQSAATLHPSPSSGPLAVIQSCQEGAASTELPHPWQAFQDAAGDTYYYNPDTEETCWEFPKLVVVQPHAVGADTPEDLANSDQEPLPSVVGTRGTVSLPHPWQAFEDDAGDTYYYNSETQETSWARPGLVDDASAVHTSAPSR